MVTRVRPYGREASIVDGLSEGVAASLRAQVIADCTAAELTVIDVVPAASTLVVTHRERDGELVRQVLGALHVSSTPVNVFHEVLVEIPVRYDGDDLTEVATACSLSIEQVIALHSNADYQVAFCGFAPGFAYLTGLPKELRLARRSSPRARVAAGSVAIAADYSAVYPRESPGGWHLIGSTTTSFWDTHRDPPALLQPGTRVRFVSVT